MKTDKPANPTLLFFYVTRKFCRSQEGAKDGGSQLSVVSCIY